jgi:hypothetical protein
LEISDFNFSFKPLLTKKTAPAAIKVIIKGIIRKSKPLGITNKSPVSTIPDSNTTTKQINAFLNNSA